MRPEEEFFDPEIYFSKQAAQAYDKSKRIQNIQKEMTERAIELLGISKGKVLDAGCGTGISMSILTDFGFDVVGIDVSNPMVDIAKAKSFDARLMNLQKTNFKNNEFDAIVSISTLQWTPGKKPLENYTKAAKEFYRILKKKGKAVVQFYPKSDTEFELCLKEFKKARFKVSYVIDWPHVPKKTKKYIILEK